MLVKNRLCNSMKDFNAFKRKNQSVFYDICLKAIKRNNDKLLHKDDYIKQIKILKLNYLNKNNKNKKKNEKKIPFTKTVMFSHMTIDDILKESKKKVNLKKTSFKKAENLPKITPKNEIKKEGNPKLRKFFHGKKNRFTVYKHITEYLESNNVTISELIENNPFQSKPYLYEGSHDFLEAVKFNKYEDVKFMLNKDIRLLFTIDYFGQTAYHWAAKFNDIKMMEILLSFGRHHNQKDFKGRTPIYLAAVNNNADMCKYLLDNHANLFLKDKEDRSPADVAGNWDLKYFLKEHMSQPFNNPIYRLKLKKMLEEREDNVIKKQKGSGANKFIGVAQQLFEINRQYK